MPAGRFKSRTFRRVFVRTPGARTVLHYRKRKPKAAKCGCCGTALKGAPRERPYKMSNLPKTKKRPERPFGGNLCSRCMRKAVVEKARPVEKPEEVKEEKEAKSKDEEKKKQEKVEKTEKKGKTEKVKKEAAKEAKEDKPKKD